jgi:hypothetical protein
MPVLLEARPEISITQAVYHLSNEVLVFADSIKSVGITQNAVPTDCIAIMP